MAEKKESVCSLTVHIIKITLRVRFPCSVCCAIKVDGQERDIPGEKELHNGEATLNLTYSSDLLLSRTLAQDSKALLYVYLKSTSGRIPAGSVPLSLAKAAQHAHREVSRIDKCPDKNAFIEFEIRLERAEEKRQLTSATTHEREVKLLRQEPSSKNIKLVKSVSPDKNKEDRNNSFRYLIGSNVDVGHSREPRLNKRYSKRQEQPRSSILENYYPKGEQEKTFGLEREAETLKSKIMIIENELANKNNRWSELEKEHKQLQKKCEQLEIQLRSATSKTEYAEKANREMTVHLRQAKEKAEEQKLNYQNIIKRLEIRQNSCKEQIKSFSEKLYASQNEKQRMVFEKNLSSNQFQAREKKLRESFKEKEKKMLEERTQLLKKIDSLQKDADKYKEEIGDAKSRHSDSIQQLHQLKLIVENVGSENQRFRAESNDLKFELTKLRNEKRILEESLESTGKFNQERRSFRKQLADKDLEISQLKDKISALEAQVSRLKSQNEQLDKIAKERSSQLKTLERDYTTIARELNLLQGDVADRDSKIASLMQELQLEMKRSQFYEGSAAEVQEQLELKQDAMERQLKQAENYKTMLEEQLQKLGQQLEMTQQQLSNTTKDLQQLQQAVEEKGQWIANLESQMIQLNNINQQWQMEKIELAEDKKELQQKYHLLLEETQEAERQYSKQILSITQQSEENLNIIQKQLSESAQKVKMLGKIVKQKEEHLSSMASSNSLLEKELVAAFAEREKLIANQHSLRSENGHLNEKVIALKKEAQDKETVIDSLRRSIESSEKELLELQKVNMELVNDHHNLQAAHRQLKESKILYQQATIALFASLISNSRETSRSIELVHEDSDLLSQANQLLNSILQNNRSHTRSTKEKEQKISEMRLEIALLVQQRDKKQESLLRNSHHIDLLRKNTNEFSQEIQQKNSNLKELGLALKQKEEDLSMLELQTSKRMNALNSIVGQKNKQLSELKQKHLELQLQLEKASSELTNANGQLKKLEKEKKTIEADQKNKITLIDSSLRTEMERVNLLEVDKGELQKQLRQEKQNLRKLMRELQSKCYQCQDLQLKLQEADSLLQLRQSQLKKFKDVNNEFKQLFDCFFHSEISYSLNEAPFNPKIEKYLSEQASKEGQFLKQRVKIYYQNELALYNSNIELKKSNNILSSSLQSLNAQLEKAKAEAAKVETCTTTQLEDFQLQLEQANKMRGRQTDAKLGLMKAIDEQKQNLELLRRFIEDFSKQISTLEKEKKLSVFVLPSVKQPMKKVEQQMATVMKAVNAAFLKTKREWDLANLRAKKSGLKKMESLRPS